ESRRRCPPGRRGAPHGRGAHRPPPLPPLAAAAAAAPCLVGWRAVSARIIDGRAIAAEVRTEVAERVRRLVERGIVPGFVDLLIGDEPASATYVRMKNKAAAEVGMRAFDRMLPATASVREATSIIEELNADPDVHGVIVQSPLPTESPIDIFDLQRS